MSRGVATAFGLDATASEALQLVRFDMGKVCHDYKLPFSVHYAVELAVALYVCCGGRGGASMIGFLISHSRLPTRMLELRSGWTGHTHVSRLFDADRGQERRVMNKTETAG
jgi:hypothetical protein